jgi:16S rRNA (cytidine1402-2'-O)-methyltransferase
MISVTQSANPSPSSEGILFLVPSTLGEIEPAEVLSETVLGTIRRLDGFIAEEPKTARAFLKRVGMARALQDIRITVLNEHTRSAELPTLLAPALLGQQIGLLSEAGYPAVADPGTELIALAHTHGVRVIPLVGPSSLLLALAASGLNGQGFCFHGYLPVESTARIARIREIEARARTDGSAQMFIEAPYRNQQMLSALLQACGPETQLCLATDLTLRDEVIRTRTIAAWRSAPPDINRRPTVFVLQVSVSANAARRSDAPALRRSRRQSGVRSALPGSDEA